MRWYHVDTYPLGNPVYLRTNIAIGDRASVLLRNTNNMYNELDLGPILAALEEAEGKLGKDTPGSPLEVTVQIHKPNFPPARLTTARGSPRACMGDIYSLYTPIAMLIPGTRLSLVVSGGKEPCVYIFQSCFLH